MVTKWECDWNHEIKYNKALQEFLASYELVEPLNPRDAFFGGRTNAVRLHHEANESKGEKLKYVDVTSLYPRVNKKKMYPVGHPVIIRRPEVQNINGYFGMAKVDVLPPPLLYHPVLPLRHGGKLAFPLCTKCMEGQMLKPLLEKSCKRSHQRIIRASRDMVHPRDPESCRAGVSNCPYPRSMALPRRAQKKGLVHRPGEHVVTNKTRISRLSRLGHNT